MGSGNVGEGRSYINAAMARVKATAYGSVAAPGLMAAKGQQALGSVDDMLDSFVGTVQSYADQVYARSPANIADTCVEKGMRPEEIKARFVGNFMKFMDFPGEKNKKELVVAFLGDEKAEKEFDKCVSGGKTVNGLRVRLIRDGDPSRLKGVDVLCMGDNYKLNPKMMEAASKEKVLTVDLSGRGLKSGACISVFKGRKNPGRFDFDINKGELERRGFKASSKLLGSAVNL